MHRKKNAANAGLVGEETHKFLRRKVSSIMPNYAVAWGIGVIICFFRDYGTGLKNLINQAVKEIWKLLFLPMAGFGSVDFTWYISAMLLAMLLIYPLCLKYFSVMVNIVAPLASVFILGFFFYTSKTPTQNTVYYGFMYKGMMRAIAEILLGVSSFSIISKFKELKLTRLGKLLVSFVEMAVWTGAFFYMTFAQGTSYDFHAMLLIYIGAILAFSHQGVLAGFFDRPIFYKLGQFSCSLYLAHGYWSHFVNKRFSGYGYFQKLSVYIVLSICSSIFVYIVSSWLRKNGRSISRLIVLEKTPY